MSDIATVRLNGRDLKPHKAIVSPLLGTRTVLTNSHWGFVALWLRREGKSEALFYWDQAREFHTASLGMPLQSSPLLHYYSFMNATKALLVAKGINFTPYHGVKSHNMRGLDPKITLSNEGVRIQTQGILPALSSYLREAEVRQTHSLEEILFNLPYIHRTYCLTYKSQKDMFIPLTECQYVVDVASREAYLSATISKDFAHKRYIRQLPSSLISDPIAGDIRRIRSVATTPVSGVNIRSVADREKIRMLNEKLRPDVLYINGPQTLWYVKGVVKGPSRLQRFPLTLTLAAMHRLSEICRYRPVELASFLSSQKNWLLSEFIQLAPGQFIDELAAELTGHQFMAPNVRVAT